MKRLNCVILELSQENSADTTVCVNGTNSIVQEISNDSCTNTLNLHNLNSGNLNKILKPEECGQAYQCDKLSSYVFVDVGSDHVGSDYLLEEDDGICKVSSETLFTDDKGIDYNFFKDVKLERYVVGTSKENEINIQTLEATAINMNEICTGNDRSGLSINACTENMSDNLDNYDKKPNIGIEYTRTSKVVSASGGFEKVNTNVKEEEGVEDMLVHHSTENRSPKIKIEEMVNDEEVSIINESIIDIKLHPVSKTEKLPDISDNNMPVLDQISKTRILVLSKPLKIGEEAIQSETETHLQLQNGVQTLSKTCSVLQIKLKTNSIDYGATDGQEECVNELREADENMEVKNKNDETCQHQRNGKSKNTTARHVCEVGSKCFIHLHNLVIHKCVHTGDGPFVCSICGKAFKRLSDFKNHNRIHTGDRPFLCSICGKAFTQLSTLTKHKNVHTGERSFDCSICGKAFKEHGSLKRHKRTHTGDRPFVCSICGKAFTQLCHLNAHKHIHSGDRPFGCSICGKAFTQMSSLTKHKRIHTGERPFGCSICGKAFKEHGSLMKHKHIHSGYRPFGCIICGKVFTQMNNLTKHKRIHSGDRPFGCSICGKAFTQLANLKAHNRIHTGERPFGCSICGKVFRHVSSLKKHRFIHTGEKPCL